VCKDSARSTKVTESFKDSRESSGGVTFLYVQVRTQGEELVEEKDKG
jgi:hypothetical protein